MTILHWYSMFLVLLSGLFLGHEISDMKHGAEMRLANRNIENCQVLITKGSLYKNNY